jgi:hypothetical protein
VTHGSRGRRGGEKRDDKREEKTRRGRRRRRRRRRRERYPGPDAVQQQPDKRHKRRRQEKNADVPGDSNNQIIEQNKQNIEKKKPLASGARNFRRRPISKPEQPGTEDTRLDPRCLLAARGCAKSLSHSAALADWLDWSPTAF